VDSRQFTNVFDLGSSIDSNKEGGSSKCHNNQIRLKNSMLNFIPDEDGY